MIPGARSDDYADGYLCGYRDALAAVRRAGFADASNMPGPWLRRLDVIVSRLEDGYRRAWLAQTSTLSANGKRR